MFQICTTKDFFHFLFYNRKKVEFLDVIAKIGAFFSTGKYFFSFLLYFYSTNFNNYKIIYNLLNHPKKPNKIIELDKEFKRAKTLKEKNNYKLINDINNLEPFIDVHFKEKNATINEVDIDKDIDINEPDEEPSFILKKLSFFDFLFNNVYCKCCIKIKKQYLIDITNDIIFKYLSLDTLLYNQIKIENLFQDYKWNNHLLNNVENNKMIIDLKNI